MKMNPINEFKEEHFYLSNFYEAPIVYDGICYCNNEVAFQAQKVTGRNKKLAFSRLNASEAKKLGRTVPLRKDWEASDQKADERADRIIEHLSNR